MKTSIFLFLVIVVAICPMSVKAATYYVATNGNDGNVGTIEKPFLTIQKGFNSVTQAGDTLYIRGGNYRVGKIDVANKKGIVGQDIVISGYQNERPVLDASGKIPGLWDQFLYINNSQYVSIRNVELANSRGRAIYI